MIEQMRYAIWLPNGMPLLCRRESGPVQKQGSLQLYFIHGFMISAYFSLHYLYSLGFASIDQYPPSHGLSCSRVWFFAACVLRKQPDSNEVVRWLCSPYLLSRKKVLLTGLSHYCERGKGRFGHGLTVLRITFLYYHLPGFCAAVLLRT